MSICLLEVVFLCFRQFVSNSGFRFKLFDHARKLRFAVHKQTREENEE